MNKFGLIVLLFLFFSTHAWAQSPKPTSITEPATYTGADREQLLYAGAKSEGTVTWYTSLAGDSYKALARAFEAKYRGVRVESHRAGGSELVVRMAEEAKARRAIEENSAERFRRSIAPRDPKNLSRRYRIVPPVENSMLCQGHALMAGGQRPCAVRAFARLADHAHGPRPS